MYRNDKWVSELAAVYKNADEIPVVPIRELAEVVGVDAALKTFAYYNGIPQFSPKKNLTEMESEYIRKCSLGQSDSQIARKLNRTLRYVQEMMSKPAKRTAEYIPMFPEYKQ